MTNLDVQPERSHFKFMIAKNPNYFGNIMGSEFKENYKLISNTDYEQISCLGYNPYTSMMEATFAISKSTGYQGDLCNKGSFEYLRFYLDFHDGAGFIDQGSVGINVHDIPDGEDCNGNSIFPISYVASLKKITSVTSYCDSPLLPTMRVILSWSSDSPANAPDWIPVWGNVKNCDVQMKPNLKLFFPTEIDFSDYFISAINSPNLTSNQLTEITGINLKDVVMKPAKLSIADLAKKYEKSSVSASRFALKTVQKMVKYPTSEITMMNKSIFENLNINLGSILDEISIFPILDSSKANVEYEELACLGLDYNSESLVATINIKKKNGYSGSLCDEGSKEYISFWIDWNNECQWEYIQTMELLVHDIEIKGESLCYSVTLPIDATFHRKLCANPNVVRVRSVLSWSIPPSTTDPNKLEIYGNRIDTHIQIKPGMEIVPGEVLALFNIIGGVDVAHIDDATGLTKADSRFALYPFIELPTDAPFGGSIVINGPSFLGFKYRIKVTNLNNGAFYYLNNDFVVVGSLTSAPFYQSTNQTVDIDGYYPFLPHEKNTLNILGIFTPGTEDKFLVELDVYGIIGVFSKIIQMDNTSPAITLEVYDNGDCTSFVKGGAPITGRYSVNDLHLKDWSFSSTYGGNANGTSNVPLPPAGSNSFSIPTTVDSYPCGGLYLSATDKTIINSNSVGHEVYTSYNICLQQPE